MTTLIEFFMAHRQQLYLALPHGAVTTLATAMQMDRMAVDRVFKKGWEQDRQPELLKRTMLLLEGAACSDKLVDLYKTTFPNEFDRAIVQPPIL
jgi:hypothetical protein